MRNSFFLSVLIMIFNYPVFSQDDLDSLLDKEMEKKTQDVSATFKTTRIISGQSIERMREGELDLRVQHRFDRINKGFYEFFGLDESSSYLGLEYGITDWVMAGIGRATVKKYINGFLKFSILRQTTGAVKIPIAVSFFTAMAGYTLKLDESDPRDDTKARLNYTYQLLLARKFTTSFSLQLTPTLIHRNLVPGQNDNDLGALGIGGRYKLSNWVSVNVEYFYVFNPDKAVGISYYNPLAIGFDIETGGHVFQVLLTNSISMIEPGFIGETTGSWNKGDIHLGFNISRVFTLY